MCLFNSLRLLSLLHFMSIGLAARVQRQQALSDSRLATPLADVTSIVKSSVFQNAGWRCCCDKRKDFKDDLRGIFNRAGWCTIAAIGKCGDVKVVPGTATAHDYRSTDGKCEIPQSEVRSFFARHGSPHAYCKATTVGTSSGEVIRVRSVALGEKIALERTPGYQDRGLECVFESAYSGRFQWRTGTKVPDFCQEYSDGGEGNAFVGATAIEETQVVTCSGGYEARIQTVACGSEGKFKPQPECAKIP